MRWGVNLRGDLAKLADDDLTARFEVALQAREQADHHKSAHDRFQPLEAFVLTRVIGRGPFHARAFYRFYRLWYDLGLNRQSVGDLYVLDCEIKDIRDELSRRVSSRRTGAGKLP